MLWYTEYKYPEDGGAGSLATAVSLATRFLLWANTLQYETFLPKFHPRHCGQCVRTCIITLGYLCNIQGHNLRTVCDKIRCKYLTVNKVLVQKNRHHCIRDKLGLCYMTFPILDSRLKLPCKRKNNWWLWGKSSRDSSVGVATSYGLGFPGSVTNRARFFLLRNVQTSYRVHAASYKMGTGILFPRG
jgi:hypothetical protein